MPKRIALYALLFACLPLLFAGCVQSRPAAYYRPPRMQFPHLQRLTALSNLSSPDAHVLGATVFQQAGNTGPQALFNVGGELHAIYLDGSGERQIATNSACRNDPAVTADGLWAACLANGCPACTAVSRLEITSLDPHTQPRHREITLRSLL